MPVVPQPHRHSAATSESRAQRIHGTVVWFDAAKGFGFISCDEHPQQQLFVEYTGIDQPGYRTLVERQPVTFVIDRNERGTHAAAVRPHVTREPRVREPLPHRAADIP